MANITDYKIAPDMREHKHTSSAFSVKNLDEAGLFAGYASVFHVVDSQRDLMLPGAFSATIIGRKSEVKLLWQHDMREPIGVIEELKEDANGLYVKGRLLLEVARAREAYSLLKKGIITGLSIGYSPTKHRLDADTGVRILSAVDLWEISLVTFPANYSAQVTVVKHAPFPPSLAQTQEANLWQKAQARGAVMRLAAALEQATSIAQDLGVSAR